MDFLKEYLDKRPPHLSLIRSVELEFYKNYLPIKGPLLDFGCGDGLFLKTLLKNQNKKIKIIGVDVSEKTITQAKDTKIYQNLVQSNSQKLPFPNNSFQTIITNCVFEHISQPELKQLVEELNRVLKKDGILIATVATGQFPDFLFFKFFPGYKNFFNKISNHHSLLSKKEWQALFKKSNFKINEVKPYLAKKKFMHLFDISHWLGAPFLISHKLTGNWNPKILKPYTNIWYKVFSSPNYYNQNKKESPYLFFALKKA